MSQHSSRKSPPVRTYSAQPAPAGATLTCSRCKRVYPYPIVDGPAIRCECGWWYENRAGVVLEEFKPRIGV